MDKGRVWRSLVGGIVLLAFAFNVGQAQTFRNVSELLPGQRWEGTNLGASAVDVNNDGWVDIYRFGHLFLNRGAEAFEDIHAEAGLTGEGDAVFGGVFGDYNGDGFVDLFIEDLTPPSFLYRNRGDGTFVRSNDEAGVHTDDLFVQGSLWADLNNDGRLDLFIGNDDGQNKLYINQNLTSFQDRSVNASISFDRNTYGSAASDYDRDGDLDIFLATCNPDPLRSIKVLLQNAGNEQFIDVGPQAGIADSLDSWGVVWLDYNNDGWQDVYVANHGLNRLYRNTGQGTFTNETAAAGVAGGEGEFSYSVAAADFDNDGWVDLFVGTMNGGSSHLYRNNTGSGSGTGSDGTFADVFAQSGVNDERGGVVSVADFNNDGWIDLFVLQEEDRLFFNEGGTNHWLKIKTRGTDANHFGVGARIDLYANGMQQVREITAGDGMTSQNHNLSAHFGLGTATMVDSIIVRWPGGTIDRVQNVSADQEITLVEGLGLNQPPSAFALMEPASGSVFASAEEIPFSWAVATDGEDEAVTYTLHLTGADTDLSYENLTETSFALSASALPLDQDLTWTVAATDGHSIRGSMDRFRLRTQMTVAVEAGAEGPGAEVALSSYPNPFRTSLTVRLSFPQAMQATAAIYDVLGRRVWTLVEGQQGAGERLLQWDGRDGAGQMLAPGVYLLRVQTDSGVKTQPILRLR